MGQKIIISGVSFFFAASYDISPTRADRHLALLIQHHPTTARIAFYLPRHGVFIRRTGVGRTSFNASPDARSQPR